MKLLRFIDSEGTLREFQNVKMSTGLIDSNGEEIFEGDTIVQTQYDRPFSSKRKGSDVTMVVAWDDGGGERSRNIQSECDYNRRMLERERPFLV